MKANVGGFDRAIRITLGLGIISLAFWGPKSPWAWLGLIPLLTGLFRFCGLYTLLGVSTCRLRSGR
jgi:hypothetical protein